MRIPSGVTDQVIYFVAVDATDLKTRETGLSSFTVYRSRDGGTATAYTTPTVTEVSSANMPGVYKLLLDEDMTIGSGNDSEETCLHITATGMAPVTLTYELYRPKITAGETLAAASGALGTGAIASGSFASGAITAAAIAADAIGASELAADAVTEIQTAIQTLLTNYKLDKLISASGSFASDVASGSIIDQLADDGTATYDRTTDSLQAIRDRGDTAWSSSSSITELMTFVPSIPALIDLANTASYRATILILNSADNLPSTAEINAGTVSIHRKARGATSWSAVLTDAALSEQAGAVYVDEVFDAGSGYAEGDHIRWTFKSISVTEGGNTFELCDANGVFFYSTLVKTVNVPTTGEVADAVWDEARAGHTTTGSFGEGVSVNGLTTAAKAEVNAEVDTALNTAIPGSPTADSINQRILAIDDLTQAGGAGDLAAVLADTADIQPKIGTPAGASLAADIATVDTVADGIQTDLSNGTDGLGALKTLIDALASATATIDGIVDAVLVDTAELQTDLTNGGRVDLLIDAIKAKTDQLTFTVTNVIDANIKRVNGVVITGNGQPGTEFSV